MYPGAGAARTRAIHEKGGRGTQTPTHTPTHTTVARVPRARPAGCVLRAARTRCGQRHTRDRIRRSRYNADLRLRRRVSRRPSRRRPSRRRADPPERHRDIRILAVRRSDSGRELSQRAHVPSPAARSSGERRRRVVSGDRLRPGRGPSAVTLRGERACQHPRRAPSITASTASAGRSFPARPKSRPAFTDSL